MGNTGAMNLLGQLALPSAKQGRVVCQHPRDSRCVLIVNEGIVDANHLQQQALRARIMEVVMMQFLLFSHLGSQIPLSRAVLGKSDIELASMPCFLRAARSTNLPMRPKPGQHIHASDMQHFGSCHACA